MEKQENLIKCDYCDKMVKNKPRSIGSHIGYYHKEMAIKLYRQPTEFSMSCLECKKLVANSNNVLAMHLKKEHNIEYKDYVIKYEYNGAHPLCKCGCGEKVRFTKGGFRIFLKGHDGRGENNAMYGKKGKNSPNFGKIRTEEHRVKYSISRKKDWEENYDEIYNKIFTEEYKTNMSTKMKEMWENDDGSLKEKFSKKTKENYEKYPHLREMSSFHAIKLLDQNKIGPSAPYKTGYYYNRYYEREEYYHSSWEEIFYIECENQDIPVTKNHKIVIPYTDKEGKNRNFKPDFLNELHNEIYEIKGGLDQNINEKIEASKQWAKENNFNFIVLKYNEKENKFETIFSLGNSVFKY